MGRKQKGAKDGDDGDDGNAMQDIRSTLLGILLPGRIMVVTLVSWRAGSRIRGCRERPERTLSEPRLHG